MRFFLFIPSKFLIESIRAFKSKGTPQLGMSPNMFHNTYFRCINEYLTSILLIF